MTCSNQLRSEGKPYPRTCQECGLGPCPNRIAPKPEYPFGASPSALLACAGAGARLTLTCHSISVNAGWWNDLKTGEPLALTQERVGDKLMLVVTEIAEAKEGHRKGKMDDHLPNRTMIEVELADAVIRIFDLAGAMNLDVGGAIAEKLAYNAQRADHKIENRLADGGKKT